MALCSQYKTSNIFRETKYGYLHSEVGVTSHAWTVLRLAHDPAARLRDVAGILSCAISRYLARGCSLRELPGLTLAG